MTQGLINRAKAQVEKLKKFLQDNQESLSEEDIDEILEAIAEQLNLIESLQS